MQQLKLCYKKYMFILHLSEKICHETMLQNKLISIKNYCMMYMHMSPMKTSSDLLDQSFYFL